MQLVINIPEEVFKRLVAGEVQYGGITARNIFNLVKEGTPLPKGHGRLIDADHEVSSDGRTIDTVCGYIAPTIIEADNDSEDKK